MNRLIKTILIISIFLPFALAQAQVDNLAVEFQNQPLFNEANFLPGEGITRWVKVTNNSGATQRIATQPLNITDPNRLGDVLNLEIKESGVTRYNNALSNFFAGGENYLSSLANGANTQYDFTVSFYSGAQNPFQGKSLGFDILIGFQGTEGGILPGAGSTSGYGGGGPPGMLPPGLTIQNESTASTTENSVIITWTTSYSATSQVIYAKEDEKHILDLTDTSSTPPKYGYARTTPEYDTPANINGEISHSITILGLTPGTKYYYRSVSHGSLAISAERSFTTKGLLTVPTEPEQAILAREDITLGGPQVLPTGTGGIEETGEEGVLIEEEMPGEKPSFIKQQAALIFDAISQNYLILFLILLLILIIIIALRTYLKKKNKVEIK